MSHIEVSVRRIGSHLYEMQLCMFEVIYLCVFEVFRVVCARNHEFNSFDSTNLRLFITNLIIKISHKNLVYCLVS